MSTIRMIRRAVRQRGHSPVVTTGRAAPVSNVELVEKAVAAVRKAGGESATAAEVRADLAAYRRPEAKASSA